MSKLCVFCRNFNWGPIEYTYYSTLTGGDLSGSAGCRKGYFSEYDTQHCRNEEEFRVLILLAEKCKDYEEAK